MKNDHPTAKDIRDLVGVIDSSGFTCVNCFNNDMPIDDDKTTVMSYDEWRAEVGPCRRCGNMCEHVEPVRRRQ